MPCVEALLAGTLALMTGVAEAAPGSAHVGPMAAKIAANLDALAVHPALSEPMRRLLTRLRPRWQAGACQGPAAPTAWAGRMPWPPVPATLQ